MPLTHEDVQELVHNVLRDYTLSLGDPSMSSWGASSNTHRYAVDLAMQTHLRKPDTGPECYHESWLVAMAAAGYKYGKSVNPRDKHHPSMIAYTLLPSWQRAEGAIFKSVIDNIKKFL